MQLFFKYDIDRLSSYADNAYNNIEIADSSHCKMLSFPEVSYFNYAFRPDNQAFTHSLIDDVRRFYADRKIDQHKIIINALCEADNSDLMTENGYRQVSKIARTTLTPVCNFIKPIDTRLQFIRADDSNIQKFTVLYLQSFESLTKHDDKVVNNFRRLLSVENLDLHLIKYDGQYAGVNVLYHGTEESLLAGGAILPAYRNKGLHQSSLAYRIQQAFHRYQAQSITAWAYEASVSLSNMLKLNMQRQEQFLVYPPSL